MCSAVRFPCFIFWSSVYWWASHGLCDMWSLQDAIWTKHEGQQGIQAVSCHENNMLYPRWFSDWAVHFNRISFFIKNLSLSVQQHVTFDGITTTFVEGFAMSINCIFLLCSSTVSPAQKISTDILNIVYVINKTCWHQFKHTSFIVTRWTLRAEHASLSG